MYKYALYYTVQFSRLRRARAPLTMRTVSNAQEVDITLQWNSYEVYGRRAGGEEFWFNESQWS